MLMESNSEIFRVLQSIDRRAGKPKTFPVDALNKFGGIDVVVFLECRAQSPFRIGSVEDEFDMYFPGEFLRLRAHTKIKFDEE